MRNNLILIIIITVNLFFILNNVELCECGGSQSKMSSPGYSPTTHSIEITADNMVNNEATINVISQGLDPHNIISNLENLPPSLVPSDELYYLSGVQEHYNEIMKNLSENKNFDGESLVDENKEEIKKEEEK